MFTRDSERFRLTLAVLGVAVGVSVVAMAGLLALANRVETTGEVYPYRIQDWLRYEVPALWPDHGKPLLLLTGASNVRENLQVDRLAAALDDSRVRQGGISLSTLADVIVSLDYVERQYGAEALPREVVLGLTPRFMAELPAARPFPTALDLYSRDYRLAPDDPSGIRLVPKATIEGIVDHARFVLLRSGPRYRASLAWLSARAIGPEVGKRVAATGLARRLAASWPTRDGWIRDMAAIGPYALLMEFAGPARFPRSSPLSAQVLERRLDDPKSWWVDVHRWDPAPQSSAIRARAASLHTFAARHGITLYAVNLPEHRLSRVRYVPGTSARYVALLHDAFPDQRILDLRCLLGDDEFKDAEHSTLRGSHRETAEILAFVQVSRAARTRPDDAVITRQLDSLTTAHACSDFP